MFAAGSVKSSKWGWDIKTYNKYGVNTGSQASNVGYFTGGCLAPNGLIYCLPTYLGAQFVTVIKPGKSNSKTGKWEPAIVVNVPSEVNPAGKKPPLPDLAAGTTNAILQRRFANKGILAPNGLIYFFGFLTEAYVVVKPQDNPNFDISAATEWKVVTYASVGLAPLAGRSGYGGGFLHTDGKIYLLHQTYGFNGSSTPIARIVPRADLLSSDTIEKSAYWNPTSSTNDPRRYIPFGGTISDAAFQKPVDITGTVLNIPTDTYFPVNQTGGTPGIGAMAPIGDAISHPNGSIYVFGGGRNAYILKVKTDSTTWNTNSNPAGAIFYTSNELRVPNKLPSGYSGALGIQGCFLSGSIEKLKPGQDPETAKIYLHYAGTWQEDISLPPGYFQNNYTRTIVFDPVTETFENIGEPVATIATAQQPFNLKPGVRIANGHIFSVSNFLSLSTVGKNPFGQLIVSGETSSDENKIIGPNSQRSLLSQNENKSINDACYGGIDPVCNQGSHALLGSSLGKTFVTAPTGGFEIVSVKGFYPGIKYFNYNESNDDAIYDIPSNLSTLPTSLYNAYFNKPR